MPKKWKDVTVFDVLFAALSSLLGLCVIRTLLGLANELMEGRRIGRTSFHCPYEAVIGQVSQIDVWATLVWLGSVLVLLFVAWFLRYFLGEPLTYRTPVVILSLLIGYVCFYIYKYCGLHHWQVIVTFAFFAAVLFVLGAKLAGYHAPGNWLHAKGTWLKMNVLIPLWMYTVVGGLCWLLVLVVMHLLSLHLHPVFSLVHHLLLGIVNVLTAWLLGPCARFLVELVRTFWIAFHN